MHLRAFRKPEAERLMASLTPGTRIGAYQIVGSLGAGGMSDVFRARDHRFGREVALFGL